jgi:signal transduction histidine kinase
MADASVLARWRHDLKNQLGIVLGFSELLLNELDPASAQRADIGEIHVAAQRALELLATLPGEVVENVERIDLGHRKAVSGEDAT